MLSSEESHRSLLVRAVLPNPHMAHSTSVTTDSSESACASSYGTPVKALVGGRRLRGLSWNKTHQLWRVRIYYSGKLRFVGRFQDAITAAKAYDKAAYYLYGANAITNFGIEACLADPSEVGACIIRAKEEAEQAAAAPYNPGSSAPVPSNAPHMSAAIAATCGNCSNSQVPDRLATPNMLFYQQQQHQQQLFPSNTVHVAGAVAAVHSQHTTRHPFIHHQVSCQPQQQQQQQEITVALSLPSQQHHPQPPAQQHCQQDNFTAAAGMAFATAAGAACGLPAQAADQSSLMQLLLEMQQQQRPGFACWQAPASCPPTPQPSLLAPSTAVAAAACHQLFTQQPQVFQLTANSCFPTQLPSPLPVGGISAASVTPGTVQQQQQQSQLFPHTFDYQSAQCLEHQLQTLALQCSPAGGPTGHSPQLRPGGTLVMSPNPMLSNGSQTGAISSSPACVSADCLRQL